MTTRLDDPVPLLDLRDTSPEQARGAVDELLATRRRYRGVRLLALDRAAALVEHESAYQAVWASSLIGEVLCVAVGPPADRVAGIAIRATPVLNNQTAATLWVGDAEGVSWPADAWEEALEPAPEEGHDSGLRALLDVLRQPDVYARVIELADHLPDRVACPGHLIMAGHVGLAALAEAQRAAVRKITGDESTRPAKPAPDDCPAMLGTAGQPAAGDSPLLAGAALSTRFEETRRACEHADRGVVGLAGRFGPRLADRSGQVWRQVAGAGRALADLRAELVALFERVDGRAGLDQARRDELERAGVSIAAPRDTDRGAVATRLRDRLAGGLDRGYSLTDLASWLGGLADQATPMGSAARVPELRTACPDELIDRLVNPPPFPWRVTAPWAVGSALAGGLLAALGPQGLLTGPLLVIAWLAAVGLAVARQPQPSHDGAQVQRAVLVHLVVAGGGCVLGIALAQAVALPWVAGLLLTASAAGGLAWVMRVWWSEAVVAWHALVATRRGRGVADELHRILRSVAFEEWALSDSRRFVTDAALTAAGALGEASSVLTGWAAGQEGDPATPPVVSSELRRLVTTDLVLIVNEAMRHCWERQDAGGVESVRANLRERLIERLADYARHVAVRGIDVPFGQPTADRVADVNALWRESPAIRTVLHDLPRDRPMAQLCGPEDLPLLDHAVDRFQLVRFAPRAAQAVLGGGDPRTTEITWTASGHIAGVLRLVPLRAGAVELNWPTAEGEREVS